MLKSGIMVYPSGLANNLKCQKDIQVSKKEVEILKQCRHESIVCYIEDFYEDNKILIIMEFCSGGDLAKFIDEQKKLLPL